MWTTLLCSGAIFGTAVQALAFWAPKETHIPTIPADAISPKPTLPPNFQGLRKRASASTTILVGPDETCGYIDGRAGAGFFCGASTDSCVFLPSTSGIPGAVGCCDDSDCGFRVACLDYVEVVSSSLCDNPCMQDTFTVKCTASSEAFCNTISFPGDIYDYYCDSLSISTPQLALTTFSGETDTRTFSEVVVTDTTSSKSSKSGASSVTQGFGSGSSATGLGSSGTTSSGPGPTSSAASTGGSSAPIGAIVGGVVGGVAVLGAIGLGVFFLLRSRNHTRQQQQGFAAQPNVAPQPPSTPGNHQSLYGPPPQDPTKHNGNAMVQTYPSPPPPFPGQPYGPPPGAQPPPQAGYFEAPDNRQNSTTPVAAGEYNHLNVTPSSAAPVSPATTLASANTSYHQGFGQGQPQVPPTVHEIGGDGNHRGTMSELGS